VGRIPEGFTTTAEFLPKLPELLTGRRSVGALVGTYNELMPDDDLPSPRPGMTLTLRVGREFTRTVLQRPGDYDVALVYAGKSAHERVLGWVRALRRRNPAATVVMLVCDCVTNEKKSRDDLLEMQATGELAAVLVTTSCGGHYEMRVLLDGLVEAWPGTPN